MRSGGIILVQTSLVQVGSNVGPVVGWQGGQGVLVISAQQLAPTINLMLTGLPISAQDIKVNSSAIAAPVVMPLMLPAGSYCIHSAGGSSVGLFAALMPTV